MENKLPKKWVKIPFGEIILTKKGKKPKTTVSEPAEGYLPYILIYEMEGKGIRSFTNDEKVPIVNLEDVLVVWDGSIGKCASGLHGAIGSTLVAITPLGNVPTRLIEFFIKYKNQYIHQTSTGTGLQHINKNFFKDCLIPLPPLKEQQRIVAKLDTLFTHLEVLNTRLATIPQLLKNFKQAVLTQAVTGKITEEWRKGKDLEKWKMIVLKDVSERITVGYVGKMSDQYKEEGIPFLRSQNVRAFKYSSKNLLYVSEDFHNSILKSSLKSGDVAIVRSGYPGTACVIPEDLGVANCSDILILTPKKGQLNSHFVTIFMNSDSGKRMVFQNRVGNAQQHFNTKTLQNTVLSLAPIEEQTEIVKRVEALFAKADKIESQYKILKEKTDSLPQAILSKAFKGELVAQLPTDGSAKELLAEIQKLKAAVAPKKKMKKKVKV